MGYTDSLAHYYDMSTPVALPDLGVVGGNPGTGANIASNPVGIHGKSQCAEMNGNNSAYNLGDVVELNAVTAFTIAFWMRQDVIDVYDFIFRKVADANNQITIWTFNDGEMYLVLNLAGTLRGHFDYSAVIAANTWHHVAMVFDGSQAANATRLVCYVDAEPVTLAYDGVIPAITADLSGQDASIGHTANSFDGLLDSFAIFTRPLTQLQVADHMLATRQGRL